MSGSGKTKKQLTDELARLRQRVDELEALEAARQQVEWALTERTRELAERVKEMDCLYRISVLASRQGRQLDEILQGIADVIPLAMRYPDDTCARITIEGKEFKTQNCFETGWRMSRDIIVESLAVGSVEIFCKGNGTSAGDGIFLKEEADLLGAVAERLGKIIQGKRAEQALQESEARFKSLFENAPDAIYVSDLAGKLKSGNHKAEELIGYRKEELIGRNYFEAGLIPGKYVQKAIALLQDNGEGRASGPDEFELIRKDGSRVYVEITTFPVSRGGEIEVIGIARDITERKRSERESRIKDSAIASSINGIAIADSSGKLTYVNPAFLEMWGYEHECEVLGRQATEFWQLKEEVSQIVKALREKGGWIGELIAVKADGSPFDVQISATSVVDNSGTPICMMASFIDTTERKAAEAALRDSERLYRLLAENVTDAIWVADLNIKPTYISPSVIRQSGYTPEEAMAINIDRSYTPASLKLMSDTLMEELANERKGNADPSRSRTLEVEARHKDGSTYWSELKVSFLRDSKGKPIGLIGVTRDITLRKKAEDDIRRRLAFEKAVAGISSRFTDVGVIDSAINGSLAEIGTLTEASRAYIFLIDWQKGVMDNTHEWCAPKVSPQIDNLKNLPVDVFPWWLSELWQGRNIHVKDISQMPPEAEAEKRILEAQDVKSLLVLPLYTGAELGGFIGLDNVAAARVWDDDDLAILRVSSEIIGNAMQRKRAEDQVKHMAYHDALTGLPNRLLLNEILSLELSQAERNRQHVAVIMLDLDGFKLVNDTLGHAVGDRVLKIVAERLRQSVRKGDIVARMGGDEFIIVLPGLARPEYASKIAKKLLDGVRQPLTLENQVQSITASIGIAIYPDDGKETEVLISKADIAMYLAKQHGRNNFKYYSAGADQEVIAATR